MPKFYYYTQKEKNSSFEKRYIAADSAREAERELATKGIPVLDIERVKERKPRQAGGKGVKKKSVPAVSLKEKIAFAQNMEQCQDIDMGLLSALDICGEMAICPKFTVVCQQMRATVSEGTTLYDAMRESGIFDSLVLGLVKAGEKSGFLSRAFSQIKSNYRRTDIIKKKVIKLLAYPVVVMFVAAICIFFLMWKTVPTFVGLFAHAKMQLPLPTRILMFVSHFTLTYPYLVLGGIIGAGFLVLNVPVFYKANPWAHRFVLRMPIFGKLQRLLIQETFSRTLSNLLSAGLKIIDSLSLCRSVSECYPYKAAIARSMLSVSSGSSLMAALDGEKDIFGIIVVRTLGFGEKTGSTEKVLAPLSNTLSSEIMDYIDNLNTVIEPLLTLMIGSIVLLIMLALFIPIFNLPALLK